MSTNSFSSQSWHLTATRKEYKRACHGLLYKGKKKEIGTGLSQKELSLNTPKLRRKKKKRLERLLRSIQRGIGSNRQKNRENTRFFASGGKAPSSALKAQKDLAALLGKKGHGFEAKTPTERDDLLYVLLGKGKRSTDHRDETKARPRH